VNTSNEFNGRGGEACEGMRGEGYETEIRPDPVSSRIEFDPKKARTRPDLDMVGVTSQVRVKCYSR
jgi:hypothetical protein